MSELDDSQPTVNVSDVEYEDFLVQINDIVQQQQESSPDQALRQHMVMLEHHLQKQLEQNRTEIKRLGVDFYKQMKLFEEHRQDWSQQQRHELRDLDQKLIQQLQDSDEKVLEFIQNEMKSIQSHLTGEVHILHKLLDKHALDIHEEKTELKKDIELLNLELKKTEVRLATAMRGHHVWVTISIISAMALYKMIEVLFLNTI